jgi:two-component system, LytTR family, sensor kinase
MRYNLKRIARHVLFWAVYIILNAILSAFQRRMPIGEVFFKAAFAEIFILPVKLGLVYFVFYYLIPRYSDDRISLRRMIGLGIVAFSVSIAFYRVVLGYIYMPIFKPERVLNLFYGPGIYLTTFDLFITLAAALTIKLIEMQAQSREVERQLQQEKMQSELNFLRAQTNPHFLFNTLNNLYGLARKKSDMAPAAIMMLSKIMRFMLYDCRVPRIPVTAEAQVVKDYIELEKLRYDDRLTIIYEENIDDTNLSVAPLLLLPLVENSFKHGPRSSTDAAVINVKINLKAGELTYFVENTADEPHSTPPTERIGLQNVRRQLDLIYPDHYKFDYGWSDGWYRVMLKVQL